MTLRTATISLAGAAFFALSSLGAQAQEVDLAASCAAQPAQCAVLVQAEIERLKALGLTGEALDAQISVIVSTVYSAAQTTTDPAVLTAISSAIETAANEVSSPAAAAGIRQAAAVVSSGGAATTQPEAFGLAPAPSGTTDPAAEDLAASPA